MSKTSSDKAPWEARRKADKRLVLRRLVVAGLLAGLLGLVGWGFRTQPIPVETGSVLRGPLTVRVTEEGKTRIRNRYVVASPAAGTMRRVPLKAGDEVRAGETLLTVIEPAESPLLDGRAREQAEAAVAMAEAAGKQAAEALTAARSALELAETERDRVRSVRRTGTVSASERDRAESEARIKAAEVRSHEFAVRVSEHRLAQARAELARGTAGAGAGEWVEVRSPVSGRVLKVMQESATVVAPGTPILELGDPADIEIEAEILSRDAVRIRPGDAVLVEQWGGGGPLEARVRLVEPAAFTKISALGVEEQRVYVLCDLLAPPDEARRLGDRYRVEVRVAVWRSDDVLLAPAGALFRKGNEWITFLLDGGRAVERKVEVGHTDGHSTEILGGLEAGDRLLLHPPDTVKDGARVKVEILAEK